MEYFPQWLSMVHTVSPSPLDQQLRLHSLKKNTVNYVYSILVARKVFDQVWFIIITLTNSTHITHRFICQCLSVILESHCCLLLSDYESETTNGLGLRCLNLKLSDIQLSTNHDFMNSSQVKKALIVGTAFVFLKSSVHFNPNLISSVKEGQRETYWAFLLHLQDVEDVVFLWGAGGPLPLQTQPGHPCLLQLWREGWQWHTAWGEQVHHFTELTGEGRKRERETAENGRERSRTGERERNIYMYKKWWQQMEENSNIKNGHRGGYNTEGCTEGVVLPYTHVIFGCKTEGVSGGRRELGHSVLLLSSIIELFKGSSGLPL